MAADEGAEFAMIRDDAFEFATVDSIHHVFGGFFRGHDHELRNGILGAFPEVSVVVDQPNFGFDESWENERDADAFGRKLDFEALRQRPDGRFAHCVIDGSRGNGEGGDAADDAQASPRLFEVSEGSFYRANDAEDIGFELAAKVVELELREGSVDSNAGIGDDDVDAPGFITHDFGSAFQVSVTRDVASNGNGTSSKGSDGCGSGFEGIFTAREQSDIRAFRGELATQSGADPGGSAGDECSFS